MDVFSFLVRNGAVADADLLLAALREAIGSHHEVEKLRVAVSSIAGPRKVIIEARGLSVAVAQRPVPSAAGALTVSALPIHDARTHPAHHGPDLGWQRFQLATLNADEGLLADQQGRIVASVMHPLLSFVSPTEVVVSTHPASPRTWALDGVLRILEEHGVKPSLAPRGFARQALLEQETWVVDPVYGARLVAQWQEYNTLRPGVVLTQRDGLPTPLQTTLLRNARATLL